MCKVKYSQRRQIFYIELEVWGKNKKIPIYVDDEKTAVESEQIITEKIDRINRNREKLSRMVFDDHSAYMSRILAMIAILQSHTNPSMIHSRNLRTVFIFPKYTRIFIKAVKLQ